MKSLIALSSVAALMTAALVGGAAAETAAAPLKIVQRISGSDGGWDYASFDPVHRRVYISHAGVMVIDVDTGKVNPHFVDAMRGHAALPINGGRELLTTDSGDNTAKIFDAETGKLEATIAASEDADGASYDPASKHVFVIDGDSGDITVIDPVAKKAAATIKVGAPLEFGAPDGKGKLYVNGEKNNEVVVIDTKTNAVLSHWPLEGCQRPTGLAYATSGLTISACGNGVADVLDATTGKLVASLKIGPRPDAVIYDQAHGRAYIPSGGDGTLAILSVKDRNAVSIVGTVATQAGARTGTLDPKTGRIYLPTAKFNPPAAAGQRPSMIPGSFEVLVIGAE